MAHLEDLKSVIIETLERRGTLNSIRGQIRAEVFNSLDDKASVKPKPSNDTILLNELVREYLEYNSYNYAAVTLRAESGQAEVPLSRDFMESELGVKTTSKTRKVFVQQGKEREEAAIQNHVGESSHTGFAEHEHSLLDEDL